MYGHLYNVEGKRIIFDDDTLWDLKGDYKPSEAVIVHPKDIEVLKQEVLKEDQNYRVLFNRNKTLYFRITVKGKRYIFEFELLEELYVKLNEKKGYDMHPHCLCKTVRSEIPFFEVMYGASLLELYRKTSVLYNRLKTSHTTYVLDNFYTDSSCSEKSVLRTACIKLFDERLKNSKAKAIAKIHVLSNL